MPAIGVSISSYFIEYMYSTKMLSNRSPSSMCVRRVACAGCFGVRNSHGEPTRAATQGRGRSRAVVGDAAFGLGGRDPQGRADVAGVVHRSAGHSWAGVLHGCAADDFEDAGVAAADSRRHVVDDSGQRVVGADRRLPWHGFSVEALAFKGFAWRTSTGSDQPRRWRAAAASTEGLSRWSVGFGRRRAGAVVPGADCDRSGCTGYLRAVVANRGWMGIVGGGVGVRGGRRQCLASTDFGNGATSASNVVAFDVSGAARSTSGRRLRRVRTADVQHGRGSGRAGVAGWFVGGRGICQWVVVESGSR